MSAQFSIANFAYELSLISEWLTRSECPGTEDVEADIIRHATEERFTGEALEVVAKAGLHNPAVQHKFAALLGMMLADHIPLDGQTPEEIAARKLATVNIKEFLEKFRQGKDKLPGLPGETRAGK